MLNDYIFETASLTVGPRKSERVKVSISIDIQDDDPFAPPPPKGHYANGFACKGQLMLEWSTGSQLYFKKMMEARLSIMSEGASTSLPIILMEMLDSSPGLPGALPGQPCRTRHYTWSFICVQKPQSDGLGLFPEAIQRQVMKVFVFTRFPGYYNLTETSAVVTAQTRQQAVQLLNDKMQQRGLAPLQEGGYSLVELDPTKPNALVVADGSD